MWTEYKQNWNYLFLINQGALKNSGQIGVLNNFKIFIPSSKVGDCKKNEVGVPPNFLGLCLLHTVKCFLHTVKK